MPLSYSDVRTVQGAIDRGIMRSAYWLFHQLDNFTDRANFLAERFPSLTAGQQAALYARIDQSYRQGLAISGDPSSARLGQLQFDPTHQREGRFAYNVEVQALATEGEVDEFGRPGVRTRFITVYSEELLSQDELQRRINAAAEQTFRDEYGRELARGEVTMEGLDYQVINVTRSF